ncbi:Citrate-binding protein [Linum grandiflorum]
MTMSQLSSAASDSIPTTGFISLPFNHSLYHIESPYNLPEIKRYSFVNGVHKCWVYSNDLPHSRISRTKPRTEIKIQGYIYKSGVWQFEGYVYVPSGTSGVSIMQVFGSRPPRATSLMLHVYDGSLQINVYINDDLKLEVQGRGGKFHVFKFGVYAQQNDSCRMESRWKNIRIFKKI